MNDWSIILASLAMGLILGGFFFGGLWWTVRKSLNSAKPALWMLCSILIRLSITLTGFYWVGAGDWRRLLVCLFGFILARLLITQATGINSSSASQRNPHAS